MSKFLVERFKNRGSISLPLHPSLSAFKIVEEKFVDLTVGSHAAELINELSIYLK